MKPQLERGIRQYATTQRRELISKDNTFLVDMTLRAGQGLIGPLASATGNESINDWFVENTDPDGQTVLGVNVGGDDSYWSAIANGTGSAAGALGSFAIAGPAGTYTYLGASGVGSVVETVKDAADNEATTGEMVGAGVVEGISQAGQTLIGGKIFSGIGKQIAGKTITNLGERVVPKLVYTGLVEGTTEAGGQVLSNVASNIGGDNVDLFEGVKKSFVAGFVVAGAAGGVGEYKASKATEQQVKNEATKNLDEINKEAVTEQPSMESLEKRAADDINNPVEEFIGPKNIMEAVDGSPAPVSEVVPDIRESVVLSEEATTLAQLSDGTEIVVDNGVPHVKAGDKGLQAYEEIYSTDVETARILKELTETRPGKAAPADPVGTAITLHVDPDGDLFIRSKYIKDDYTLSAEPTGKEGIKVKSKKGTEGGPALILASRPVIKDATVTNDGRVEQGKKAQPIIHDPYFIANGVTNSVGAAGIQEFLKGKKESKLLKKYREAYGELELLERGILQEGYEFITKTGEVAKTGTWSPYARESVSVPEATKQAITRIQEKGGLFRALDYLNNLTQHDRVDKAAAIWIKHTFEAARLKAIMEAPTTGDYAKITQMKNFETDAMLIVDRLSTESGASQQLSRESSQRTIAGLTEGDAEVMKFTSDIQRKKLKEANAELGGDADTEVDIVKLNKEVVEADEAVAAIEEKVGDPVKKEIQDIDDAIQEITNNNIKKEFDDPIKQYTEESKELKRQEEQETLKLDNQLSEADKLLKDEIKDTGNKITEAENEIAIETQAPLQPTKAQSDKIKSIDQRIDRLRDKDLKLRKQTNEKAPKKATEKQFENYEKRVAQANEALVENAKQLERAASDKAAVEEEIKERVTSTRKPTSEAVKKLNDLKKRMTNLLNQFEQVKKVDPKKSNEVKKLRSLNAQRKKTVRDLTKAKKKASPEPTARQKQLLKRKEDLILAKKEGRIKTDPDISKELTEAKRVQASKKAALTKALKKLQEATKDFPPEAQDLLRKLVNAKADNNKLSNTELHAINKKITELMAEHLPPTSDNADMINNFWRRNVLSGPKTLERDASFNFGVGILDTVSTLIAEGPAAAKQYIRGRRRALQKGGRGRLEAKEIMEGNRAGRMTLGDDGAFKPLPINFLPFKSGWFINELIQRVRSVNDSMFYRSAEEGRAYTAAYQMAKAKGVAPKDINSFIEDTLYGTTEVQKKARDDIDALAVTLKSAGIEMTPRQKELAFLERMQANRSDIINASSQRHGNRSVLLEKPDGALGIIAEQIIKGANEVSKLPYGSIPIPVARDSKGKFVRFYPAKHLSNFVRTAANATKAMMRPTPLGGLEAYREWNKPLKLDGKDVMIEKIVDGKVELDAEGKPVMVNAIDNTDARSIAVTAMMGTVALGVGMNLVLSQLDSEDPWIQFYGMTPKGKWKDWKEKGISELSIRIGENTFNVKNSPLAILAAALGAFDASVRKGEDPIAVGNNVVLSSIGAVASLSFLKNVGELYGAVMQNDQFATATDSDKADYSYWNKAGTMASNTLSGYIPSVGFFRNMSDWIGQSPPDTFNEFDAKLLGRMPFADALGISKPALNKFGSPILPTLAQRTTLDLWFTSAPTDPVIRWMKHTGYDITDPPPVITLPKEAKQAFGDKQFKKIGYRDIMDKEQSRRVLELSGPRIRDFLAQIGSQASFKVKTEENQKYINKRVNELRAEAMYKVLYEE
jgi:hypothetical protein